MVEPYTLDKEGFVDLDEEIHHPRSFSPKEDGVESRDSQQAGKDRKRRNEAHPFPSALPQPPSAEEVAHSHT
jgi:hypothetical protein